MHCDNLPRLQIGFVLKNRNLSNMLRELPLHTHSDCLGFPAKDRRLNWLCFFAARKRKILIFTFHINTYINFGLS